MALMNKRILELLFIGFVISLLAQYWGKEEAGSGQTAPPRVQPSQTQSQARPGTLPIGVNDVVPEFQMSNAQGEIVAHKPGTGPLFISLTATGCGECIQRIDKQDATAYEMARKSNVPVWNMLVYHPQNRAASFVEARNPVADQVLADPTALISVRTLGGSDSTCWMLIDKEGKLAYRGPVDLKKLEQALGRI